MIRLKPILIFSSIAIVVAAGSIFGHRAARTHVNYMTAVDDHPITCWTCHIYTQQDNFLARMQHETYVSPYNLAISEDGNRLYVIAQERRPWRSCASVPRSKGDIRPNSCRGSL